MAIEITPTTNTTTTVTQPVVCDTAWSSSLTVTAPFADLTKTTASATLIPYNSSTGVAASESWPLKTANLNRAMANVPAMGTAFEGVLGGLQAWHTEMVARQATLATAQATLAAAQATLATATTAVTTTKAASDAAYKAAATPATDPTYQTARQAYLQAVTAQADAQAAVTVAQSNVTIATAATADVANDPLVLPSTSGSTSNSGSGATA